MTTLKMTPALWNVARWWGAADVAPDEAGGGWLVLVSDGGESGGEYEPLQFGRFRLRDEAELVAAFVRDHSIWNNSRALREHARSLGVAV